MDYFLLFSALYLVSAAQLALAPVLTVGQATPNFLAAAAGVWMLVFRDERSLVSASLWGLAADLAYGGRLGPAVAIYLLVAFALLRMRPLAPVPGWLLMAAACLAVLTITLAEAAARAALEGGLTWEALWPLWWGPGVYASIIAVGLMFLVRSAVAIFGPDEPATWGASS